MLRMSFYWSVCVTDPSLCMITRGNGSIISQLEILGLSLQIQRLMLFPLEIPPRQSLMVVITQAALEIYSHPGPVLPPLFTWSVVPYFTSSSTHVNQRHEIWRKKKNLVREKCHCGQCLWCKILLKVNRRGRAVLSGNFTFIDELLPTSILAPSVLAKK